MQRILIVEGEEDRKFFEAVLRSMGHADEVNIRHQPSGKSNAIAVFAARLDLLTKSSNDRIGLAIDADAPTLNTSDGFTNTQRLVNEQLQNRRFGALTVAPGTSGSLARSNHLSDVCVGLWVMPDNRADGYLEDFANAVVAAPERSRHQFASNLSRAISEGSHEGPPFAFKPHHLPKATVGAWLAWSDPPRMNLGTAVSRGLLDMHHPMFCSLVAWLTLLYFP